MRSSTEFIVVHCSATPDTMDIGAETIRRWHKEKNFRDIGYQYVIRRDGTIEPGRDLDAVGAHVKGFNNVSVGICLIGGVTEDGKPVDNFTKAQLLSLKIIVSAMKFIYPYAVVQGHRDFPAAKKACPCFDVKEWWRLCLAH